MRFHRDLGHVVLRIEVGNGKEHGGTVTFKIHRRLLCTKVKMFEQVFSDTPYEEILDDRILPDIALPEDDPKAFKLFAEWLYTDKIDDNFRKSATSMDNNSRKQSLTGLLNSIKLPIYIKLCILAEQYEITPLENEAINFLIKFMVDTKARANPSCWLEVYKRTGSTSALRVLFSRIAAWQLSHKDGLDAVTAKHLRSIVGRNEELRLDIVNLMESNMEDPVNPFLQPACDYHNHGPVDECPCPRT